MQILFFIVTRACSVTPILSSFLKYKGIQPSMLRKGNSPDNGIMGSFWIILKSEIFYSYEKTFQSLEQSEQVIKDYIDYHNNKSIKIKVKLKGRSAVQHRTTSFYLNKFSNFLGSKHRFRFLVLFENIDESIWRVLIGTPTILVFIVNSFSVETQLVKESANDHYSSSKEYFSDSDITITFLCS